MRFTIRHITTYSYSSIVNISQNHARLSPWQSNKQKCLSSSIEIFPKPAFQNTYYDHFDNLVTVFELFTAHQEMKVVAQSEVELFPDSLQTLFSATIPWENVKEQLRHPIDKSTSQASLFSLATDLTQYTPAMHDYALQSFIPNRPIVEACQDLMNRIFNEFTFDPSFSTISTPITSVFEHKRGVCQDFAHFTLACIRSMGLAARYVSGYIETIPPPGEEKLEGADATHAWVSVFIPNTGWLDYDPTNNLFTFDQHVTVAVGRDFADVTPIKGVMYGGGTQTLDVAVDMNRMEITQ